MVRGCIKKRIGGTAINGRKALVVKTEVTPHISAIGVIASGANIPVEVVSE